MQTLMILQCLIGFLLVKEHLNTLLATKMLKIKSLCIFLPKMTAYRKEFDETKYMIKYDKIFDKR